VLQMCRKLGADAWDCVQREVLRLFLEAFNTSDAPLKTFILRSIKHHVAHAQQDDVPIHEDELLMSILNHNVSVLVARAVAGIGDVTMQEAIDHCEAKDEWWSVAQLWFAASKLKGQVNPCISSSEPLFPFMRAILSFDVERYTVRGKRHSQSGCNSIMIFCVISSLTLTLSVADSGRGQNLRGRGQRSATSTRQRSHVRSRVAFLPSSSWP